MAGKKVAKRERALSKSGGEREMKEKTATAARGGGFGEKERCFLPKRFWTNVRGDLPPLFENKQGKRQQDWKEGGGGKAAV